MEYLGRIDDQVQLRGFRIELGEIESTINKHNSIKDTVVIDRQEKNGDKYLCAYIVCKEGINQEEVRTYLSANLPDYMIPSYFVELDKLPLTSSGKKDRKSLPEPDKIKKQWEPPTNKVEEGLIKMWCEILGISEKKIGVNYNIFDLGGNSIKVTVYKTRIMNNLDIDIPLSEMMKNPSFKELATYIESVNLIRTQESNSPKNEQTKLII
ncbi:MAG: hypothetical protein GQ564_00605, partial [Bacteroidales bacterium]|nr:hypothetical protein [Bacteroidales bacterium]